MKSCNLLLFSIATIVTAAPGCKRNIKDIFEKRQLPSEENEGNCGPFGCGHFNTQDQYVDVRPGSAHEYRAPEPNDRRGPCPGLNAAANHGFLNRNGITTILQATTGLQQAYGMDPVLATALAGVGVGLSGDPLALPDPTWSIGWNFTPSLLGGLAGFKPSGISFTHNSYEGDGSPTRFDAYLNNGNPNALEMWRFNSLYNKAVNGELTPHLLRIHNKEMHEYSLNNNPRYFQGPFAGLVPAVAHQFIINFFSNHSAERPDGFLTQDVLKSFFAISGSGPSTDVWIPGQERIPGNWYRRPSDKTYGTLEVAADALILASVYPEIITSIGGNTGEPNSFVGVNFENLADGVFNTQNLVQGDNAACFAYQASQTTILSRLRLPLPSIPLPLLGNVQDGLNKFINTLKGALADVLRPLQCPELTKYNQTEYEQFPGWIFKP